MFRFRLDNDPAGHRYVRQSIRNGEATDLPAHEQSSYRFGTYNEAIAAGEEWEQGANYRARVHELEREGLTTSDAQAAVDAELMVQRRCGHGHTDAFQGCTCWSGTLAAYQPSSRARALMAARQ